MKLALGTVQFGLQYGVQDHAQPSMEDSLGILNKAYAEGIRTFDTASAYGKAEAVLGAFLRQPHIECMKVKVISKLSPKALDSVASKHYPEVIQSSVESSLKQLNTSYLDGYMFHNPHHVYDQDAVKALAAVKAEGLLKRIGVSIYTPQEAMCAVQNPAIDIIQIPYNVFDRRLDNCNFFAVAAQTGVTVYARSSLLQGLLLMDRDKLPVHMTFASRYLKQFKAICDRYNTACFDAAVGYVMQHHGIDYLVFGVDNLRQLIPFTEFDIKKIDHDLLTELKNSFHDVPDKLVMPNLWNVDSG